MTEGALTLETNANHSDIAAISQFLNDYNADQGLVYNPVPLSVFIRDQNGVVLAGLTGSTHWGWLRIKLLAVGKANRRAGLGGQLLAAAEKEAIERGCKFAFVDTFTFQAAPFYEKNGYERFAELDDYPAGEKRIFLRKKLQ